MGSGSGSEDDLQAAAALLHRAPPRQSSDSTLHPPPSGRPSSAPSHRSSFDSCVDGATSDPSRSQRSSLEHGSPASLASAPSAFRPSLHAAPAAPAALSAGQPPAAAAAPGAAAAGAAAASGGESAAAGIAAELAGNGGFSRVDSRQLRQPTDGTAPSGRASPFASSSLSLPMQPQLSGEGALQPVSAGHHQHGGRPRGHRAGRDPGSLEHGSTAPPGALDALAEALAVAVSQQGGGGGPTGAARFAPPRRAAAGRPPASPPTEPLLSSQVALLAQQLLLHRQQAPGASSATAAAQLGRSLQLQDSWPGPPQAGGAPPRPLMRSRTVAAEELLAARGRTGLPSAAQQLLISGGAGGVGGDAQYPQASAALRSLDPAHQPRFSNPASPPSEEASPFSAVQGALDVPAWVAMCGGLPPCSALASQRCWPRNALLCCVNDRLVLGRAPTLPAEWSTRGTSHFAAGVYGCHLLPPVDHADPHSPEPSPGLISRQAGQLEAVGRWI